MTENPAERRNDEFTRLDNYKEELPEQVITVSQAERWMDRPIKVDLTVQITEKTSNSQTFYVDEAEAYSLIEKLESYLEQDDFGL